MKIVVVGGVASGTKVSAKLMRENRDNEVIILTKSADISYAGCGLPYYISGDIEHREELIVNTPQKYEGLTGVKVLTECEVTAVNPKDKSVTACRNGKTFTEKYDKLIIASGADPIVPDIQGKDLKGVFTVRTPDDADAIRNYIAVNSCRSAVVVGAGFIGLEVAENLMARGLNVSVIDFADQIMPNAFDREMADYARVELERRGMNIKTSSKLLSVQGSDKAVGVVTDKGEIKGDVVILALGIRPSTAFLEGSGVALDRGAVMTDAYFRTNIEDIYAIGDCAIVSNLQTGKPVRSPMGSTANIAGRKLAKLLSGSDGDGYGGVLGTGVVKLFDDLYAGRTGLTEYSAKQLGYSPVSVVCVTDDKAHYYPDASYFATKLIADSKTGKLLGLQVIGGKAVDKMTDIAVVGIVANMKLHDFDCLDFAYAPPFSTALHPFVQACYILENKMSGELETISPAELADGKADGYTVVDALPEKIIADAEWVALGGVKGEIKGLKKNEKILIVCGRGKRAYFMQNRLKHYGYTHTKVLEGGLTFNQDIKIKDGKITR